MHASCTVCTTSHSRLDKKKAIFRSQHLIGSCVSRSEARSEPCILVAEEVGAVQNIVLLFQRLYYRYSDTEEFVERI